MDFLWQGLRDAVHLLLHGNRGVGQILVTTLKVAGWSTLFALALGLPAGLWLGLGRFRGRRAALAAVNAGLGLPPIVVGLIVSLLLFRQAPFGGLHFIYTINGVIVAQTVLSLPVVAALSASAVQGVPPGLLDQARALGASRTQVWRLALGEARVGILAAVIAALGSALSEVGAVVLVGGNIQGRTETLASAVLTEVSAGEYSTAIAIGLLLLGLILMISVGLTLAQQREAHASLRRAS